MDKNNPSSKHTSRIQLSQEAIPELLKLHGMDSGIVQKACEWWVSSESKQSQLREEFAYVVTQLDEYMRWRTSLQGRLYESVVEYRAQGKTRSPFQQFLRERDAFVPEYPREAGPRLEYGLRSLIGESRIWREVVSMVQVAAFSSVPTLICGEVGSGKSQVARVIHESGNRSNKPYLPIPCNYLSHENFRSQIREMVAEHGHVSDQMILKEMFRPFGTIFFSDIDQLPMPLQPLIVEQVRERYEPNVTENSGDSSPRIIVSTSDDLSLLARRQLFRHDLFLEVAILQLDLPPLRQRREDIPILSNHYLDQLSRKYGIQKPSVHLDAKRRLQGYAWPGNMSELRTVLDRALLRRPRVIEVSHLHFDESDWLPLNSRDQDMIHTAVGILERAGFRIGSSAPERLISFMMMKGRHLFKTWELAETLGVAHSTARNYLSQLHKLGFVEKHGDRKSSKWSVNLARLNGEEE